MGFTDPDYDGVDDSLNPIMAPGIWERTGYADATEGYLLQRTNIPALYQANYNDGFRRGRYATMMNPGVN